MKRFEQVALGIFASTGLAFGTVALTGCSTEQARAKAPTAAEQLEEQNRDLDHFETDFKTTPGLVLEGDRNVRIPFTGDFFTPPTEGLHSGQGLRVGQIAEVDLIPPPIDTTANCVELNLPSDAQDLNIKVVVNNNTEPIYARASGQTIKFCNVSPGVPASVGVQVTNR